MGKHIANRDLVLDALRADLVGPSPAGAEYDCSGGVAFKEPSEAYGPFVQAETREEILLRDKPIQRYGVGVLFPFGMRGGPAPEDDPFAGAPAAEDEAAAPGVSDDVAKQIEAIADRHVPEDVEDEGDDFDLSRANGFRPSSMGVSFLATFTPGTELVVHVTGGRYRRKGITVADRERDWWLRSPVEGEVRLGADLFAPGPARRHERALEGEAFLGLSLAVEVFDRPYGDDPQARLLTVCVVNRTAANAEASTNDERCLFQAEFRAAVPGGRIEPYPGPRYEDLDDEEQSLALLYRRAQTFAVGHGCAADWGNGESPSEILATSFPVFETPSVTPLLKRPDGSELRIPMAPLAGLVPGDDSQASLEEVIVLYRGWIAARRAEAKGLAAPLRAAADRHLDECARCADRMVEGLDFLRADPRAWRAFQLANKAILMQQLRATREARPIAIDAKTGRYTFGEEAKVPDLTRVPTERGNWRPFQIGFLLMALRSAADGDAPDRGTVELIWFPTGGGKTEAYLGLTAFATFLRRLRKPDDVGVHTLMRYTLRLLTAQQFQRAAALICAMEVLRREDPRALGQTAITIGIWLGGQITPNQRKQAVAMLRMLQDGHSQAENLFLLTRCPWCAAQMGPLKSDRKKKRHETPGIEQRGATVVLYCPDTSCDFADELPVLVIDEDLYEAPPSLIIGTVDKFARLAWEPRARAIFGLDSSGRRVCAPPGLIIQDELHLISGPLGSTVGLWEPVIEALCTDRRDGRMVRPKIVSSTATIRRYADQIKALYARAEVSLFPPPGLDAGDSFFARYAEDAEGKLAPGRKYVGVHGPGLSSHVNAQVRTYAALLQAPMPLDEDARDPWWTMLVFFNSIRALGTTVSLFQTSIPHYLLTLRNRLGLDPKDERRISNLRELTARLQSDEVPNMIAAMEVPTTSAKGRPIDVCLASNIIEVGVDIDRLSLMCVAGQPKTTAQYIQVTGRVGRRPEERPGLVVTVYNPSKPRDRSHFEKFRSYHERLYAQVEPTSVTPFAPPLLDRALHAVMAAYVRQTGTYEQAERPFPLPDALLDELSTLLYERVLKVDPAEAENFKSCFAKRIAEWKAWSPVLWDGESPTGDPPLLREAGAYANGATTLRSWATPMSMRNVDATCEIRITGLYAQT